MVDDVGGVNKEVAGVTSERRRFGVGVLESGLGEEALFVAVLVKVSTKFDLTELATAVNVARRCRLRSVGEGLSLEETDKSALRCSIVVLAFCAWEYFGNCVASSWMELDGQYQMIVQGNRVGKRVRPRFHAADSGSLNRASKTKEVQTASIGSAPSAPIAPPVPPPK
jgi:hypothetical protein